MLELPGGWVALTAPSYPKWEAVKDKLLPPNGDTSGFFTPESVHDFVRRNVRYQAENIDEWSEPAVTLQRGYGDCEDIAILERALLLSAGYSEPLYVLIAYDKLARQDHALLIAGNDILDCRTHRIIPLASFADYRPIFAFGSNPDQTLTFGQRTPS